VSIENSSKDTLILVVNYNRSFILNRYGTDTCISSIIYNSTSNYYNCISFLDFDTTKLVGTYKLDPKCTFGLLLSLSKESKFEFDTLKIISTIDTIRIAGTEDNLKLFKKHKWEVYKLRIN
jgi:hypothetical protein